MLHPTPRVSASRELTSSAAPGARAPLSVGETEGHCFAPGRCGTRRVSMHSHAMGRGPRAPKLRSITDVQQLGAFGASRLEKLLTGPLLWPLDQDGNDRGAKT